MKANAIVGQSGGPTAAINASLCGVFEEAVEKCDKVYGMKNGIHGFLQRRIVDLEDYIKTPLDRELLKRTPSAFLGSCRMRLPEIAGHEDVYEEIFQILDEYEIKYFFYIGGNDSMDTVNKLSNYALLESIDVQFVGVPKTIDNDLVETDHTPGYGSAAKFVATVTKEVVRDALVYDQDNVTILEIMGRNSGWLTGASALAKGADCEGPDLVYLPEIPFDEDHFLQRVAEKQKDRRALVIAVSEGVKDSEGTYISEKTNPAKQRDSFGHTMLSGVGQYLSNKVTNELGYKSRGVQFSILQRSAAHIASFRDIEEAYEVGLKAVRFALAGETGIMVKFDRLSDDPYSCDISSCPVEDVSNEEKVVPRDLINDEGDHVTGNFIRYAKPLIQGELSPIMVEGLPGHLVLDGEMD